MNTRRRCISVPLSMVPGPFEQLSNRIGFLDWRWCCWYHVRRLVSS